MFYNDHQPPHFHARYAEYRARVSIETGEILDGRLPPRATRLVQEWVGLHGAELDANWQLAQDLRPLERIEPLP